MKKTAEQDIRPMTAGRRGLPLSLCVLYVSAVSLTGLTTAGCRRSQAPKTATVAAPWTPEGQWRREGGMVLTTRLRPDGALVIIAPSGKNQWAFPKAGPERWSGPISRRVQGTLYREGDQLVFRREPTAAGKKPIAEVKGLVFDRKVATVEERMTRVSAVPGSGARK